MLNKKAGELISVALMEEAGEVVRRVNGVRQVWQKHLGRWKPVLEDNQLASEFVEEAIESYQTNPGAAEAAFENIELSTFEGGLESTPLLGGGAAAASGGVSTSTAVGGVLVGANWNQQLDGKEVEATELVKLYL
jgi:hypothetical protein